MLSGLCKLVGGKSITAAKLFWCHFPFVSNESSTDKDHAYNTVQGKSPAPALSDSPAGQGFQ